MRIHQQRNMLQAKRIGALDEIQRDLTYLCSDKFAGSDNDGGLDYVRTWEVINMMTRLRSILQVRDSDLPLNWATNPEGETNFSHST